MKKFVVAASVAAALMSTTAVVGGRTSKSRTGGPRLAKPRSLREFARIFEEETGHTWVDSALAGSGTGANPVIISRIIGGDPMGATQMNTGRDAEELIQAGLMRDLTDIADEIGSASFYVDEYAARALHVRRPHLLLPHQHPLVGLAVALHRRL